ncbi:MAG TPA: LysR family substrate-binding domain-containing protein [Nocardioides sp.]
MSESLRIGFVPGVNPDKWAKVWRRRLPDSPLDMVPVGETQDPRSLIDGGDVDMCFVRLPIERDALHLIPLWEEMPVAVLAKEHPAADRDEIPLDELLAEQLVVGDVPDWEQIRTATPLPFPPMTTKDAIEVVASGTGMAILPMAVARLHNRKDVVHRPVLGLPTTRIGLAWLVANDDPRLETFIGIVRGRRETSSRENPPVAAPKKQGKKGGQAAKQSGSKQAGSKQSGQGSARGTSGKRPQRTGKPARRGAPKPGSGRGGASRRGR